MATAFVANAGQSYRPAVEAASAAVLTVNHGVYTVAAALVDEDTVAICKLPAGHVPVDWLLSSSDLDTGETPAIVLELDLENGETDISLIAASTIGQGGGVARAALHAPRVIAATDAPRSVRVRVSTAPATGATSGTIAVTMLSRPVGRDD